MQVPGLVVVHWSATARRFVGLRRGYALLLSVGCAWLLASVPYQSSVAALLMLALLDVVLVSFPGSPVQRLDAIARERRAAGEPQMPGLVSKHDGLELGLHLNRAPCRHLRALDDCDQAIPTQAADATEMVLSHRAAARLTSGHALECLEVGNTAEVYMVRFMALRLLS